MTMEIVVDAASFDAELLQLNEVSPLALKSNPSYVESLFEQWLSLPNTNRLVTQLLTEAKAGRPLNWDKGKAPQSRKGGRPLPSSRVRSSARSDDRAAFKDDALNELRAKRLKLHDPEAHRKLRYASRSEDDGSSGDDAMIDSDDERSEGLTFDDIKEITIRRSKLAKWFMEPFLEELIVVCVVRVRIGRSKSGTINGGSRTGRHGGNYSSFGSCSWCGDVD
ncbi:hypothetical protein FF1_010672 [Malus domestica]